jgi:hypothetical protein
MVGQGPGSRCRLILGLRHSLGGACRKIASCAGSILRRTLSAPARFARGPLRACQRLVAPLKGIRQRATATTAARFGPQLLTRQWCAQPANGDTYC